MQRLVTHLIPVFSALLTALLSTAVEVEYNSSSSKRQVLNTASYDDLFFYYKYASSAYRNTCAKPNGNTFVSWVNDSPTDTQSYISRDDIKKEIVISFRGSNSLQDFLIGGQTGLTSFSVANISGPPGTMVHKGIHTAWNSIATKVRSIVHAELSRSPGYSVVTTGHALGGALSSLAGITLKELLPNVNLRMYTYGQPRTGNGFYADWVDRQFNSENLFRSVHTTDPIPHLPLRPILNYTHHGVEYWTFKDPPSAENTKRCSLTREDRNCSAGMVFPDSVRVDPIIEPHVVYFGVLVGTAFCT